MTRKTLAALAATIALALPAASAFAGTRPMTVAVDDHRGTETRSLSVSVADLNLASSRGARLADSRITRAAKQVCGWKNGSILPATPDYRACFGKALDGARTNLDALARTQRQS